MKRRSNHWMIPSALCNGCRVSKNAPAPVISLYLSGRADQHGRRNFLFENENLREPIGGV
jgi:hypothetical protein